MTIASDAEPGVNARSDRDIRVLFVLGGAATAALLPFFTPLLRDRGLSPDRIGLVLSAMALAGVVAMPLWSHEADTRLGTTRTLVLSTLATAGCALLLIPAGSIAWAIAAASILMAAASAPGTALGDALALGVLGPKRANDFGRVRRFASLGWAVAVILFGALYQVVGLEPSCRCTRAPSSSTRCSPAGSLRAHRARGPRAPGSPRRHRRRLPILARARALPRRAPTPEHGHVGDRRIRATADARGGRRPLPDRGRGRARRRDRDPDLHVVGLAGTAVRDAEPVPGWGDRVDRDPDRLLGVRLTGQVAVFRTLAGVGFGLKYAALVVLTDRLVEQRLRNTGQALMQMAQWSVGPIVGPAIGGFVYVALGPPTLFAGSAAVATVGALVSWWALRRVGRAG